MYNYRKTSTQLIRVAVRSYKGQAYIDFRQFWRTEVEAENEDESAWKFSKKGFTVRLIDWEEFKAGLEREVDPKKIDEESNIE